MKVKSKSMFDININKVLCDRKDYSCYSLKKIREFDHDDFASYVLDYSDINCNVCKSCYFLPYMHEYFEDLPKINNVRVFLYGVWDVFQGVLNYKIKHEND